MTVYKLISAVQKDLAEVGIAKDSRNTQQGYQYRGIDEVYNVVAPLLAKHGLVILPRVRRRECVERVSKQGAPLFFVTVEVAYDFVSAHDGSRHTIVSMGEGFDSSDKATNKAMSAAYKYAIFQAFCVPVDVTDADAETILPAPLPARPARKARATPPAQTPPQPTGAGPEIEAAEICNNAIAAIENGDRGGVANVRGQVANLADPRARTTALRYYALARVLVELEAMDDAQRSKAAVLISELPSAGDVSVWRQKALDILGG